MRLVLFRYSILLTFKGMEYNNYKYIIVFVENSDLNSYSFFRTPRSRLVLKEIRSKNVWM